MNLIKPYINQTTTQRLQPLSGGRKTRSAKQGTPAPYLRRDAGKDRKNMENWIKTNREALRLSQAKLAAAVGVGKSTVIAELFGQRATLLYDDFDQSTAEAVLTTRSVELWLLEDMTVTAVASVSVVCEGGAYVAEYRENLGDPWTSGMCLDLEELTDRLDKLCWPVHENEIPVYEL